MMGYKGYNKGSPLPVYIAKSTLSRHDAVSV